MAALLGYVEIIRSLYHIDVIRQNFRRLQHTCNAATSIGPCTTCQIKDLFNRLSSSMRNSVINPLHLTNIISKTHLISKVAGTNRDGYELLYTSLLSLLPPQLELRAVYSLTKVCLTCNTYSHAETVEKSLHKIETVDPVTPSFEFGIKSNLDSNEFCDKPHCFGSLRIFRVLKQIPNLLTLEFENMTTCQLPPRLKPCLIFECASSTELSLTCITLCHPPGTIFYHSRLHLWIHLDSISVTPISTYAQIQAMNLRLRFAYYTKTIHPPGPTHHFEATLQEPITTYDNPALYINSAPFSPTHDPEGRIYENWPLDSDEVKHWPPDSDSEVKHWAPGSDSGQGSELNSSLSSEPLLVTKGSQDEGNRDSKYATIKRRKVKGRALPVSVSVPDLSHLDPTKKVSFDCQVTLVDEGVEDYIPHPILQRLLAQMKLT